MDGDELEPNRIIRIVPGPNEELLSETEFVDYYDYRRTFLTWLLKLGKDPKTAEGYSPYTVSATGDRAAAFDRWERPASKALSHDPPIATMQAVKVYRADWGDEVEYTYRGSLYANGSVDGHDGAYFLEVVETKFGPLDSQEVEARWQEIVDYLLHSFDNGYNKAIVVDEDD